MTNESRQVGKISGKALLVIVLVLATIGLVTFLTLDNGGQENNNAGASRQVTDSFLDAASKRDADASYAFFSEDRKTQLSQGAWQVQLAQLFADPSNTTEYVSTETLQEGNGRPESQQLRYVTYLGPSDQKKPYSLTITVVSSGDSWRVEKMDVEKQ